MTHPLAEQVLEHHGVKGMKWGVRRRKITGPEEVAVKVTPGKRVQVSGGRGHSPTVDAIVAAKARQKAKASSLDSLSNEELRTLVNRMNLESQYANLSGRHKSAGAKFVTGLLTNAGKQEAAKVVNKQLSKRLATAMAKTAAKAAV